MCSILFACIKIVPTIVYETGFQRNISFDFCPELKFPLFAIYYTNPGYGLSLVDTLWNAGSYRQPLEQEGNPMT